MKNDNQGEALNWKKLLKELKLKHIKKTSPSFYELSGGDKMKIKPYDDSTANGLTRCVIDFLTHNGHYANRINTTGIPRKETVELAGGNSREIIHYTPSTTNKGTADIHTAIKGRFVSIEIKIGRDVMSKQQEAEKARVENGGGVYFVANDFPGFYSWYQNFITL